MRLLLLLFCFGHAYLPHTRARRRVLLRNVPTVPTDGGDTPATADTTDAISVDTAIDAIEAPPDDPVPSEVPLVSKAVLESRPGLSRRQAVEASAEILFAGIAGGALITAEPLLDDASQKLNSINLTQVAAETSINVTLECGRYCVTLDTATFQKKRTIHMPSWIPWTPDPVVIKDIPNAEVLTAAIVAGSVVEMARTTLLYPLLTLKTRIQTDVKKRSKVRKLRLRRRLQVLVLNAKRHFREGRLYAGLVPSLLVSVPATGVFYGVRDVAKRGLLPMPLNDLSVSVTAAVVADVVSLMIRTPADTLALRMQVASGQEAQMNATEAEADMEQQVGNWLNESLERLPAIIWTDLPYLLSRIAVNRALIHGNIDMGRYEVLAISSAVLCAFLTTPFDVARTRILVDSDDDPRNGIDGGSRAGLWKTFQAIVDESGVPGLFAGWLERTAYLGIGRAWLEPLQIVGYFAIRDAILLEWFD